MLTRATIATRLRLALEALFGRDTGGRDLAARCLRQREETRADLDKLTRAVLLGETDAAKRIAALALQAGTAGGNLETWEAARKVDLAPAKKPPRSVPLPEEIASNIEEVLRAKSV